MSAFPRLLVRPRLVRLRLVMWTLIDGIRDLLHRLGCRECHLLHGQRDSLLARLLEQLTALPIGPDSTRGTDGRPHESSHGGKPMHRARTSSLA